MNRARFFSRSSDMGLMCLSMKSLLVGLGLPAGAAPFGACASPMGGRDADSSHGSSLLPAQLTLHQWALPPRRPHEIGPGVCTMFVSYRYCTLHLLSTGGQHSESGEAMRRSSSQQGGVTNITGAPPQEGAHLRRLRNWAAHVRGWSGRLPERPAAGHCRPAARAFAPPPRQHTPPTALAAPPASNISDRASTHFAEP